MKLYPIEAVGLEVETALHSLPQEQFPVREVKDDGSIHSSSDSEAWEVVSEPLTGFKQVRDFWEIIKKHYDVKGINDSMGFHIHTSYSEISDYVVIYSKDFYTKFLQAVKEKFLGEGWIEKRFHNGYCSAYHSSDLFDSRRTLSSYDKRYHAVNYRAITDHKTIEFRVFPSATVERMDRYLKFTVRFIKKYLQGKKIREREELTFSDILGGEEEVLELPLFKPKKEGVVIHV